MTMQPKTETIEDEALIQQIVRRAEASELRARIITGTLWVGSILAAFWLVSPHLSFLRSPSGHHEVTLEDLQAAIYRSAVLIVIVVALVSNEVDRRQSANARRIVQALRERQL